MRFLPKAAAMGLLLLSAPMARADTGADLQRAIRLFNNLDDEQAAQGFRKVLGESPTRTVAARAHLYLGLIAFNASSPEGAISEFKLALRSNPAIELPRMSSPKVRLLLSEVRNELAKDIQTESNKPEPLVMPPPVVQEPPPVPPDALASPPPLVTAEPAVSHPRPAAIALGIAGVLVGGVAIYGAIDILSYQGLVSGANRNLGSVQGSSVVSAHGQAQVWAAAWIPLAIVGAGCLGAAVFTW
jgi:hypothetical protein